MSNLPIGAGNDPNAPWNTEEHACYQCGKPIDIDNRYCSERCAIASMR